VAEDEFRVEVELGDEEHHLSLGERLRSLDLDDEAQKRLGHQVTVTRDGPHLFLYTATREAAAEAERVVRELITEDNVPGAVRVTRWNPEARSWRDADLPLPETEEEKATERAGREPIPDEETEIPHPLFVWSENYKPEFMRDLGL
jgi:hypothetical protein